MLGACESIPDFIGTKDKTEKLKGIRNPVFVKKTELLIDPNLAQLKVVLPEQVENIEWPNSSGSENNLPPHLKLKTNLQKSFELNIINISNEKYFITSTPIIASNKIFVLNAKGDVLAYSLIYKNKSPLWIKNINSPEMRKAFGGGGITFYRDVLYVTSGNKEVVALNAETGKEIWRIELNNGVRSAPQVIKDKLFVKTIDNKLYALSTKEGKILWTHDGASESIGIFGTASIFASDEEIIVPHSSGQLHKISTINGEQIWSIDLNFAKLNLPETLLTDIDVTPFIHNNKLYIAGNIGAVFVIDLNSGELLAKANIENARSIWVAEDYIYAIDGNNKLYALYEKTMTAKWITKLPKFLNEAKEKHRILLTGPLLAGNHLVVVSDKGKIYFIDPNNGDIQYEYDAPKDISLMPVVANNKLVLLNNFGKLVMWE